ncbi:hypothetical protein GCM10010191_59790 [Actinomadura vinacea]|uniref:Uncharacterized protein n=1 Tax=Actinomadura vinacea TaxID=115336 RepID=A0ABN3JSQ9_9ACTN
MGAAFAVGDSDGLATAALSGTVTVHAAQVAATADPSPTSPWLRCPTPFTRPHSVSRSPARRARSAATGLALWAAGACIGAGSCLARRLLPT